MDPVAGKAYHAWMVIEHNGGLGILRLGPAAACTAAGSRDGGTCVTSRPHHPGAVRDASPTGGASGPSHVGNVADDGGMREVIVSTASIRLGQFLKLADLVDAGSDVKSLLADARVLVNGEPESRRGRQLVQGDVVTVDGVALRVG
jgi:ribosome-associated protein